MKPDRAFQFLSYTAVFFGFFALWISGVFGVLGTVLFVGVLIGGWFLEETRWRISERVGTALVVLSLPLFYALFKMGFFPAVGSESPLPGILSRLIVTLSAIKVLQRKSDRDWIFLYVMSFFQVLLAAGLSISALYLASFIGYVFTMVSTIIVFEIRRTRRAIETGSPGVSSVGTSGGFAGRKLPATALVLIVFIIALAAPLFFLLPRVGGAGFGGNFGGGVDAASGFSDSVRLGGIGRIQQNDQVVMRVKLDDASPSDLGDIRWRGIALDTFDNQTWRKSKPGYPDLMRRGDRDLIQVDNMRSRQGLVWQTVYLEPLNSSVLFALPRVLGLQGEMSEVLRDGGGSIASRSRGERISYRALSDSSLPDPSALRRDNALYSDLYQNYLQLPDDLDPRISELASEVTGRTQSRYDAARSVEQYLQTQFGYTLEQKAGGEEPLSDFLFNVREGHCEYFATAMAIMLRTQGIATRVVNGFQRGDFNDTAEVFVVRQRNAHSWVEVYFPTENAWVTFDPTPFAGQNDPGATAGIAKRFNSYLEALEMYWIQYFVAYDRDEQKSLFTSVRRGVANYGKETSSFLDAAREQLVAWWRVARGDEGVRESVAAIGWGVAYLCGFAAFIALFVWLCRWVVKLPVWGRIWDRVYGRRSSSVIEFYERMNAVLASKGFVREPHQTPLEFAIDTGRPEAVAITRFYNSVRFGGADLSRPDVEKIETWLKTLRSVGE
jgi:protein-glutamine gamma-glutamyltransferase